MVPPYRLTDPGIILLRGGCAVGPGILPELGLTGKFQNLLLLASNFKVTDLGGHSKWEYKIWKFRDFSNIQIFREIHFAHFEARKNTIFTI